MRVRPFLAFSAPPALSFAALIGVAAACGGSSPPAQSPAAPPASASPETDAAAPESSPPTTTTLTLGDAGDLQGSKLTTSTSSVHESAASDAGPPKGPHTQEPGRAVKDIQTIIQAHRDEARACYDKSLKDHPGIEGNLDVKWTIDPTGKVVSAAVDEAKSDIHEPQVSKCIVDLVQSISFSVSAKGFETRAHYPFNFHPRNSSAKP